MDRRSFLELGALAYAASDRIQIGVVGVGGRGSWLARTFQAIGKEFANCRVAAVCDVYEKRRRQRSEQLQCDGYLDYRELINRPDIDAVVVATPDHWHARISIEAMEKGKDVYVEKPMCHTIEEARAMVETSRRTGRIVQVGAGGGSSLHLQAARKLIAEGRIGKLVLTQASSHRNSREGEWNWKIEPEASPDGKGDNYIDWKMWLGPAEARPFSPDRYFRFRKYWDYSGGIATDLFYHLAAPLIMTWGEPQFPSAVTASGGIYAFHDREVPDTFHMLAEYPKGHSLVLTSSMANSQHSPFIIAGREGSILFEGRTGLLVRPEKQAITEEYRARFGEAELPIQVGPTPEDAHLRNFLDCVRSRSQPNVDALTGACGQVVISMAVQAYRRRQVLTFEPKQWKVSSLAPCA